MKPLYFTFSFEILGGCGILESAIQIIESLCRGRRRKASFGQLEFGRGFEVITPRRGNGPKTRPAG